MPMMKNSTLFIVEKLNYISVDVSESSENMTGKSIEKMKSVGYIPSAQTIRKILDFALAYKVMDTETTGHIEMNLN